MNAKRQADMQHQADDREMVANTANRLMHCAIAVRDWLAGGCDTNDIPRSQIAVLVTRTKETSDVACVQHMDDAAVALHPDLAGLKDQNSELRAQRDALAEVARGILVEDMLQYLPDEYVARVRAALAGIDGAAAGSPAGEGGE